MTAEAINAASLAFKKALIERALAGEMNHHLGYPAGATKPAVWSYQDFFRSGIPKNPGAIKGQKNIRMGAIPRQGTTFRIDQTVT